MYFNFENSGFIQQFSIQNVNISCFYSCFQPAIVHKNFLKGVVNCLLQENPNLFSNDKARSLFLIIQSPVFLTQSSYTVLAHVLRNIVDLPNGEHQLLVHWFRTSV